MEAPGEGAGGLGLLTGIDRGLLAAYCQAHALWVEAVSSIERYGTMVKSPNGYPDAEPLRRGRQQAGRDHGPDRRRVRHDALAPAPASGSATSRPRIPSRRSCKAVARAGSRDDPVTAYARAVTEGQVLTNRLVRLACERHLDDLASGAARGLRFDLAGGAARDRLLRLPAPLQGRVGRRRPSRSPPGRRSSSARLFGWQRADGLRRFRTAYCAVPRKNGKSTLSAGIGALPAGRRRRAGRRDLLRRHHPRPGADRVRRGQAHGRAPRPRSSAGSRC